MEMEPEIPIIDCSEISGPLEEIQDSEAYKAFTKKLGDTMSGIGFAYFVNHGIPKEKIDSALQKTNDFFCLPREIKSKYRKQNPTENFHGWYAPEDESLNEKDKSTLDRKECFDSWGLEAHKASSHPTEIPGIQEAIGDFRDSFRPLAKKIMRSFALYLNLEDPDFFINNHRASLEDPTIKSHTGVRTNYYIPFLEGFKENTMRLTEHNDWTTVTFLIQDHVGGLEAKKTNGDWVPVPPIKDSIIFNAGIMLEMWSGGRFPATAHRVRLLPDKSSTPRQSMGFFMTPDGDSNCASVVEEKEDWNPLYPKMTKDITQYDYFIQRVKATVKPTLEAAADAS